MKAPKYIDNSLFSFIERTRKKKQHLDYLSNIKKDQRFQTDIKEHLEIISKYQTNKINTSIVNYQNRINELENRNKKIMGKIISISNRDLKKVSFFKYKMFYFIIFIN